MQRIHSGVGIIIERFCSLSRPCFGRHRAPICLCLEKVATFLLKFANKRSQQCSPFIYPHQTVYRKDIHGSRRVQHNSIQNSLSNKPHAY